MQYIINREASTDQEKQNANRLLGFLKGCTFIETTTIPRYLLEKSMDTALNQYISKQKDNQKPDKKLIFLAQTLWNKLKAITHALFSKKGHTIKHAITLKNKFFYLFIKLHLVNFSFVFAFFVFIVMLTPTNTNKITIFAYFFIALLCIQAFLNFKFVILQTALFYFFKKEQLIEEIYDTYITYEFSQVKYSHTYNVFSYLNYIINSHETTAKDKENANKALGFIEGILSPMASILIRYQTTKAMNMAMKQYLSKIERNRHISDV